MVDTLGSNDGSPCNFIDLSREWWSINLVTVKIRCRAVRDLITIPIGTRVTGVERRKPLNKSERI